MPADLRVLPPLKARSEEEIAPLADETPLERLRRVHRELMEEGWLEKRPPTLTMIQGGEHDAR